MDAASINTIILAGGKNKIPLYEGYEPGYKALLEFKGKYSVEYVIDALKQSMYVKNPRIVGPQELKEKLEEKAKGEYVFIESGEDPIDNIRRAINETNAYASERVLAITADIPLITAEAIDDFLKKAYVSNADVCSVFVHKEHFDEEYPEIERRFFNFRGGPYAPGNLFLFDPQLFKREDVMQRIEGVYEDRKHPIKQAKRIGIDVILLYFFEVKLFPLVSLEKLAKTISKRVGINVKPIESTFPEVELDIDYAEDYEFMERILG